MSQSDKEAEIACIIYSPGYSHAENVIMLLGIYTEQHGVERAIDMIHDEVVD